MNKHQVHQIELEKLFSKNQLVPRVKAEFANHESPEYSFKAHLRLLGIPEAFGLDLLAQMAIHKRANISTLVGILRHHNNDNQLTADWIAKCYENGLVEWDALTEVFITQFSISDDVQEEIDRYQYPLPMVVEPMAVTNNTTTGYLVCSKGSLLLKDNHHDQDICLDHINRMNKVMLCLEPRVYGFIANQWKNLDRAKPGESKQEYESRKRAFQKYDRTSRDVLQVLTREGNEFYLTHKYDKRGRIYCQGYAVTYQGNTWNKAVINFAEQEHLTQ